MKKKFFIVFFVLLTNFSFAITFSTSTYYGDAVYLGDYETQDDFTTMVAKIYSELLYSVYIIPLNPSSSLQNVVNHGLTKYNNRKKNDCYQIIFQFDNEPDWIYLTFAYITSENRDFTYVCLKLLQKDINRINSSTN